jgi:hypothetical protein
MYSLRMRVRFWELCNKLELIRSSFLELVQTKPVQSKTASLWSCPVRLSCWTGPDRALPQTGIVWTGGIIANTCSAAYSRFALLPM